MSTEKPADAIEPAQRAARVAAAQCRAGRTLLGWSVAKLATAASVTEAASDGFQLEWHPPEPAAADLIRNALEAVGVVFLPGDDVRLRPGPAVP